MAKYTPTDSNAAVAPIVAAAPVVPVLIVQDAADANALGQALVDGGLPALEVTLRSPAALDAIAEMAKIEGGIVGAGTLLTEKDVKAAKEAGATFGVSPGATPRLIDATLDHELPMLFGVASASEAMILLEHGYTFQKFFPAEAIGGAKALGSLASPLPQITFCPTGGVSTKNAGDYLRLPNVKCVGGSWVAPKDLVSAGDWAGIKALATEAAALTA